MNEREYNKRALIDYLLGSLPDEEAEAFDELSFTDENFSDVLKAAENDLIDAYLHHELSDADLEKFKTYYLSSPLRREKVNFAKSLQKFAGENVAPSVVKAEKIVEKTSFWASLNVFANPVFGWSAAAVMLLLIILSGVWFSGKFGKPETDVVSTQETLTNKGLSEQNENTGAATPEIANNENKSPEIEKEKPNKTPNIEPARTPKSEKTVVPPKITVASFILNTPLRGAGIQTIKFSKETALILMTLKTESQDYKNYQVALVDESNKKIWQSGNLKIRNESINVSFPANLLKPRIYSLILSGIGNDGDAEPISSYSFKAVRK